MTPSASDLLGRVLLETIGVIADEENSAFLLINQEGELLALAFDGEDFDLFEQEVGHA